MTENDPSNFLKQRISNLKNILAKENEMPKIDQIFKYELKTNFTEINDLLHYMNGIIYKNLDTFQKLKLLYSYDDNNCYNNTGINQNTFLFLLKQKSKFREKYINENYMDYLRTNPLIFVDTLNQLLIIPGINFEFKVYNFDEKVNKFFVKKPDIKINSLYNPCFIKIKESNFKNIVKINRKVEKNPKKNEHQIEHYFAKRNSVPSITQISKIECDSKEDNLISKDDLTIATNSSCKNDDADLSSNNETKIYNEACDKGELDDSLNSIKQDSNSTTKKHSNESVNTIDDKEIKYDCRKEKKPRRSFSISTNAESNIKTNTKKTKGNYNNSVKRKYDKVSGCKKLKKGDEEEIDECEEEDDEEGNSLNNDGSTKQSIHTFYDLINEYEIYINNAKCYIIFDLKGYYKNLDIMKKLKKNLEDLKRPTNDFKKIIDKKTFKSYRDKIEFVKRFKKFIIPNFRLEKIRKQRNHLIIVELMSKIQNRLIIKRLNQELTNKVNLENLINDVLKMFSVFVENMKDENVKKFYTNMINTYFRNKNISSVDFKNLIQLFKKKEEHEKSQEFYDLFQNDLNYLDKNKTQCDEIEEKISSLKYLILESILKEKQLERSVNRLLLNHEQSKYGYFYKIDQSDENTLDTTEYGKLLENFSKEPINFYTILSKRNLDKHAYHDIRNFNYKKKDIDMSKHDATNSSTNQGNYKKNKQFLDNCKFNMDCNQRKDENNNYNINGQITSSNNPENNDNNSSCNIKDSVLITSDKKTNNSDCQIIDNNNMLNCQKYIGQNKPQNENNYNTNEYYKCKIKKIQTDTSNEKNNEKNFVPKYDFDKKQNCAQIDENKSIDKSVTTNDSDPVTQHCSHQNTSQINGCIDTNKNIKESHFKKSNSYEDKRQINPKTKHKFERDDPVIECGYELETDIIRSICEKKKFTFANEKQEKINNEIFYKVFEQYPYSFFSKSVKNYNAILNENEEESELSWLTMLKKKSHNRSILPPSRDTFRDGTHFSNCRATEHTLKFFLSLLSLLTKGDIDVNLKKYLKKNIQFLNTELFSMKLNLDKKRAILEKRLDHFNFQENSEFSFYNPLKMNIRMMNLIGRGGFAEVWEVFDSINLEMYAAKIHKIEPSMTNEIKNKIIQRAENEINIHIHCHRHIFIVKLEFFFVFGSATNLLVGMELCDVDLDKYIKYHGPINELLALSWIKQILLGLLYMKNLPTGKVHHCDLKPANLLIKDGIIKISDFGLAKLILPDTYQYYNGGGTLYYQPPECLKPKRNLLITDKIDIWSLGCILYEMIFCERPFQFNYLEKCSKELLVNKMKRGLSYPKINQHISKITLNYIEYLLNFDHESRPSIEEALSYPIFNYFNIP
ncbi:serine/threonine protein kinase, putative [Plasmodium chabaudi chabaudi]|uniref:Serine/threonine protein kinase, putative n=1 Tax=Plasmodium chabaudi chabaudi TaxID=31271 RepID=A0A1D3LD46_PLACU|nr:serine/threonine protein kinase, putative [Plasmodium chabaudi chabaudi]